MRSPDLHLLSTSMPQPIMEWSTPSRMVGQTTLSTIPNELYLQIFDHVTHAVNWAPLQSRKTLSSLSFVCRLFYAIAIPRIFRTLHILGRQTGFYPPTTASANFCASILQSEEPGLSLARYVTSCRFLLWEDGDDETEVNDHNRGILDMYGRAMKELPNLHSITLSRVFIHEQFLKAICNLSSLKSLSIDRVDFELDIEMPPTPLKLKEFSLTVGDSGLYNDDVYAETILHIVDPATLESLTLDDWKYAKVLLPQISTSVLVNLSLINMESWPVLWDVIEKSTLLKSLVIDFLPSVIVPTAILSASSIPKLQRLVCSPDMLYLLAGRPVSSVEIIVVQDRQMPDRDMVAYLKQSSAIISNISVPRQFYYDTFFFQHFPDISTLNIIFEDLILYSGDTAVSETISKWPPVNSVTSLRFSNLMLVNVKEQQNLLPQLTLAFPNLLDVTFFSGVQWRRVTTNDSWIAEVPFSEGYLIRRLHHYHQLENRHYDDVFRRFCDQGGLEEIDYTHEFFYFNA